MATPDQTRIERDRSNPRIIRLWWALRPLTSVVRFMESGAHPDDEHSAMLAALAIRDGLNISYACSTRGEGGQNDIGTEAGTDLGALRTREMERACEVLGMRMYWHSECAQDEIIDFGFSKSGVETLRCWGRDRTIARFVEIVRFERPDVLCPTFLDVPGQHGHHRAMTEAAHVVMAAAADPGFPSKLPVWQISKLYLPAWSGAGQSYDDVEPPPYATLTIPGAPGDPISGWSWDRIGQQSRAYHRTQGMGRWVPAGATMQGWPLHLAECHVPGPDDSVWAGLPRSLADLGEIRGAAPIRGFLIAADRAINDAVSNFPNFPKVAKAAMVALVAVKSARGGCPPVAADQVLHRLEAKEVQLGHVIRLALGVEACARVDAAMLVPGARTNLVVEYEFGHAEGVDLQLDLPDGMEVENGDLIVGEGAAASNPYRAVYDPAVPHAPAIVLTMTMGGETASARLAFEAEPFVLPSHGAVVEPVAGIVNRALPGRRLSVLARSGDGQVSFDLPDGWGAESAEERVELILPEDVAAGLYRIPVLADGAPAKAVRKIAYPHISPTANSPPAELRIQVLDVEMPKVTVGYVGGGSDRVAHWLGAMGADVADLSSADLMSEQAFVGIDTLVIGIFALRFRPGLAEALAGIHCWTEAGGTLVTLYHRPWDNWWPDATPPRRIEIGQPSFRWRVTDENAQVRHLVDHPILSMPNRIGPEDWDGWVKERGLYFAKNWDGAYVPLLEMADPEEAPLRGALLVADVGAGRHIHTSLILHHQLENLVPGAFRLMANMIARRG